jgi:hypothetical protein
MRRDPDVPKEREVLAAPRPGWWGTTRDIVDTLAKLAAMFAVIFAAMEYVNAQRRAQIAHTIAYHNRFETGDVAQSVAMIDTEFRNQRNIFEQLLTLPSSPEEKAAVYRDIVSMLAYDANGGKGLEKELDVVIGFFDNLNICVEEDLCQRSVAIPFFGEYAVEFYRNFEPYIEDRRRNLPQFAASFERFVKAADK